MKGLLSVIMARLLLVSGWRRFLLALGAGGLAALSLPPAGAWPVLLVSFPVLVWLLDGAGGHGLSLPARMRAGFGPGYAFGLGWFAASMWWIGEAFLVDAAHYAWAAPLAVVAMPAGLALFWGLAGALASAFWTPGPMRIFLLAASLTLAEGLRGHLFGGFPWNMPAHALSRFLALEQTVAATGVSGLSFLVVLWAAAPALAVSAPLKKAHRNMQAAAGLAIALSAVAALAFGEWRLAGARAAGGPLVRVVQPDIPQKEKWKPANGERIFRLLLDLTARPGPSAAAPRVIVWPESAVPFLLDESPRALKMIGETLASGQILITGALRREGPRKAGAKYHNSVMVIDDAGRIVAVYDKRRLVPFGEFLPLAGLLEPLGLRKLVFLPGGFAPGPGESLLKLPELPPAEPLICYEAIFPARRNGGKQPGWLVNVTNDAWFGHSAGPYQHLAAARLRAMERGLPLVRAANTGVSAVIDAHGREIGRIPLETRGILTLPLPPAAPPLLLARWGEPPVMLLMAAIVLAAAGAFRRRE